MMDENEEREHYYRIKSLQEAVSQANAQANRFNKMYIDACNENVRLLHRIVQQKIVIENLTQALNHLLKSTEDIHVDLHQYDE